MRVEVPGVGLSDSPIWWQKFYNYYEDNYYEDVEEKGNGTSKKHDGSVAWRGLRRD